MRSIGATAAVGLVAALAALGGAWAKVGKTKLAPDGLETSQMGLGALHFAELPDAQALNKLLNLAVDNGITLLDLADIYAYNKSAEMVGQAFKLQPGLREKFQIVYKTGIVFPDDPVQYLETSPAYLNRAVDIALTQLGTTYIDVLMPHAPDPLLDANEVAKAFKDLVQSKKVKYVGVSNYSPSQLQLMQSALEKQKLSITTAEFECSVLTPTPLWDGRLDQLQRLGIAPLAWGPLGGDPLAGANRLYSFPGERQTRILKVLDEVAKEQTQTLGWEVTNDQVALAWLLRHPARIVPVIGTVKPERLAAQAKAADIELTRSQWTRIMGASAVADYKRWEQLNDGQWHDVANDYPMNSFGTPLGVDVPIGFCDLDSCKAP